VSDDLSEWRLKDADELEFAVEVGSISVVEAESIQAAAQSAIADIAQRRWPFNESAWGDAPPSDMLHPATLPDGWHTPAWPTTSAG
jgi:hypothetical protein